MFISDIGLQLSFSVASLSGFGIRVMSRVWQFTFLCNFLEEFEQDMHSVQFSSVIQSCPTLCKPLDCSTPGLSIIISQSLLKLMPIESVMPSSHLILYCPLLLLPSILPSIRLFSKESVLHIRWPKYWSFSFSINPSNDYSGLISFRMDWLDLLAVQGTLKSLLQHHGSKASILQCSAFFIFQLSHPHMTTGKTIALTRQTFVDEVMSPFFNMLSRLLIIFLPRSKSLLISSMLYTYQQAVNQRKEMSQNSEWHQAHHPQHAF